MQPVGNISTLLSSTYVCRCCQTIGFFKDLSTKCNSEGKELYEDLLKITFNIEITSYDNGKMQSSKQICDDCISKLMQAFTFRNMVISSENRMAEYFKQSQKNVNDVSNVTFDETIIKTEIFPKEEIDDPDCMENDNNDDECYEEYVIITELSESESDVADEPRELKRNESEMEKRKSKRLKTTEVPQDKVKEEPKISHNYHEGEDKLLGESQNICNKDDKLSTNKTSEKQKIQKHIKEDSIKLLKYSNICLFKSLKTKFQCYHCNEKFIKMGELRTHYNTHTLTDLNLKRSFKGYTYKNIDISSLKCKLCSKNCMNMAMFQDHLQAEHCIEFVSSTHMFIPYQIENEFKCVICEQIFSSFVRLSTHMHCHSTNNVCELCGIFFFNRYNLRGHVQSVHKKESCSLCKEKFEKKNDKLKHMRTVHNKSSVKRYCTCGEFFSHSYMLLEHKIKAHGFKRKMSNCTECDKTFNSPQNLKIHIRAVHVKERNFPCNICGMRFFTRHDEKRHRIKHDDAKSFTCEHCEGKFKSKNSWRRHLRTLHNIHILK